MKKRIVTMMCSLVLTMSMLVGCGSQAGQEMPVAEAVSEEVDATNEDEVAEDEAIAEDTEVYVETEAEEAVPEAEEGVTVRIGGLKGPTSIGLLPIIEDASGNKTGQAYEFTMATAADEIMTMLVKGELDVALIPANVSSVLYNKTEGGVAVIDINTLGVLYMVSGDEAIAKPADLDGKTVYLTGKGTTPDYVLQYILQKNDLEGKVTLEYKSEATEVAAVLAEDETAIGLLPQPFVTVACAQNENLNVVMDMTKEWDAVKDTDSELVTGVTVVRRQFLEEHENAVQAFLYDHKCSTEIVNADVDAAATLVVAAEILPKEPIAKKAIPQCNITFIEGEDMKKALSGYLSVLADMDPKSVGGKLPEDDFYYSR